jgi:hypothetical protein
MSFFFVSNLFKLKIKKCQFSIKKQQKSINLFNYVLFNMYREKKRRFRIKVVIY